MSYCPKSLFRLKRGSSEKLRLVEIHDDGFLTFLWIIFNDSSRYNQGRKYFAFIVEKEHTPREIPLRMKSVSQGDTVPWAIAYSNISLKAA